MAVHSLRTLSGLPGLASIVLVITAAHHEKATEMLSQYGPWSVSIHLTAGGTERQDSVAAGLATVDAGADLVIVHDAARPFVSFACLTACVDAATASGAAIAAVPVRDTVKIVDANATIAQTLDRQSIWLAQTPQVFRASLLRQAYERARRDGYLATDDAMLVERMGATVRIVPSESTNQKITTPDDLRWAEWYLQSEERLNRALV